MKPNLKKYVLEMLTGLFFAATLIVTALASAVEIPFIYQGF